jgi:hypothetical protein
MGKLSSAFEKADRKKNAAYPYRTMNFHSRVGNLFPNSQQLHKIRCNFKGLSQHEGMAYFSKNLCAALFTDDLSNEPNLGRINLAGQYRTFNII